VKLGDYKELEVPKQDVEVSDADVDARLKSEQESQAELVIKEDEAAENGDNCYRFRRLCWRRSI
jgi:trigger factor